MKHHVWQTITIAVLCLLYLAGCGQSSGDRAEDTLKTLTSAAYEGRLYGTKGNEKTQEYIAQKLETYGFEPFEEDYAVPFETDLPTVSSTSLSIAGDTEISFQEGTDFFSSLMIPIALTGMIPENAGQTDGQELKIPCDGGISLVLQVSQFRMGNSRMIFGKEAIDKLTVGVSSEAMDKLTAHAGETVTYRCEGSMGMITLHNVMGILKGKDHSRALVLGAHFDHMGMLGNTMYAGAWDNASGVSALLAVCRKLSGQTPDTDIVMCFWNAEEEKQQGSSAMAEFIQERYESCCYINLDCIGLKDGGDTLVTTNNDSDALCSFLAEALAGAGCTDTRQAGAEDGMMSDHASFSKCPSVNIGQGDDGTTLIHTPDDTAEWVDGEKLEQIATALTKILLESPQELLAAVGDQQGADDFGLIPEEMEPGEYESEVEQRLAYDEYMLTSNGRQITGVDGTYFDSLEEAQLLFPELTVKEQAGDYQLVQIRVGCLVEPADGQEEDVGKILKREFHVNDIYMVTLFYKKGERAFDYRLLYDGQQIEDWKQLYHMEQAGKEGGFLIYREDKKQLPEMYMRQIEDVYFQIGQGDLWIDANGICQGCIDFLHPKRYTKKSMLSLVELVEAEGPLVQIDRQ